VGQADAKEVVQVYVAPVNPPVMRPARELKGYDKKFIAKGTSQRFFIHLGPDAFSYYDEGSHAWKHAPHAYKIQIGASSADIRLEINL